MTGEGYQNRVREEARRERPRVRAARLAVVSISALPRVRASLDCRRLNSRTRRRYLLGVLGASAVAGAVSWVELRSPSGPPGVGEILAAYDPGVAYSGVSIQYPYDQAVFPPESVPPTFRWSTTIQDVDVWLVHVTFKAGEPIDALARDTEWTPDDPTWKAVQARSLGSLARVSILGVNSRAGRAITVGTSFSLSTSKDRVGAPLFYREVPLPFIDAVKDPRRIRWRFGSATSRTEPPIVLENLPVCGNCHSFSADGRVLGMDVDYANDKGSYVVSNTAPKMVLAKNQVITWSAFRKEDTQPTFGLLSQVSPNGRYVVSTVKDRSVFVPKPDIAFSQLFFPLKGILAFYDRETGTFSALPGADDPEYVQSNPSWSPDGQYVVFARARAYDLKYLKNTTTALLSPEECAEFLEGGKTFRFDLYRVPFNDGKGGAAVPIEGASGNGRSNFFAKYSPDGRWIVFCQANSFMLLQPDSELYIIPSQGGEARRLGCNTRRMNSWHSWSPNGKWLVFSSKADSAYTQLFLAHMDENGQSSPPILLSHLTAPDRAANIPEFVNLPSDGIRAITELFVDDRSYMRTAQENLKVSDPKGAAEFYRKALAINPNNAEAHTFLGGILADQGQLQAAREHLQRAIELDPKGAAAHFNLGNSFAAERRWEEAVQSLNKAIELDPANPGARNNLGVYLLELGRTSEAANALTGAVEVNPEYAQAHHNLANALSQLGRHGEAMRHWQEAVRLKPSIADAQRSLGAAMLAEGDLDGAVEHLGASLRLAPNDLDALMNLATAYYQKGDPARAVQVTRKAANLARMAGRADAEHECQRRLLIYADKAR